MNNSHAYAQVQQQSSDDIIREHQELVRRIAFHLLARLPKSVHVEDLIQAGMIGLLEAHQHYDPSKGASFTTYAGIRIRGHMLDEVRKNDWAPRSVYRNARMLAEAIRTIEHRTGRDAKPKEIAAELGISLEEYHKMLKDSTTSKLLDLDDMENPDETLAKSSDQQGETLFDHLSDTAFREFLVEAINRLPERERLILSLYYSEELNLKEIGHVLSVSESRVSQLHAQAMARLRARVKDWR